MVTAKCINMNADDLDHFESFISESSMDDNLRLRNVDGGLDGGGAFCNEY